MKTTFSINKIFCAGIFFMVVLASCTKSDHFYKDYVIERTYVGKVDSVWIKPGENRMKMYWLNSKDLSAKDVIIYWNDNKDSAIAPLNNATDTGSFVLSNLEEGDYLFRIISTDSKGNRSLPIEKSATIYGKTYKNSLLNQGIDHVVLFKDSAIILWNNISVEATLVENEIEYTDKQNKKQVVSTPVNTLQTTIYNVDTTKMATVRSLYSPGSAALDHVYSNPAEYNLHGKQIHTLHLVSNSDWAQAEFIDFKLVKVYKADEIPSVQAQDIDVSHLRGGGSKHNFITINSTKFSAFSSTYQASVNSWEIRNKATMINIGKDSDAQAVFESLDEFDFDGMEAAYQNAENDRGTGTDRLTLVNTGDIILIHSIDRGLYIAIKATYSEPDGIIDIEFKVSRP